jgi:hypothetical protein
MTTTSIGFQSQKAPCGRIVVGESHEDQDGQGLIIHDWFYACGCRTIIHEYHDGSMSQKVIRHDGKVLVDELLSAE